MRKSPVYCALRTWHFFQGHLRLLALFKFCCVLPSDSAIGSLSSFPPLSGRLKIFKANRSPRAWIFTALITDPAQKTDTTLLLPNLHPRKLHFLPLHGSGHNEHMYVCFRLPRINLDQHSFGTPSFLLSLPALTLHLPPLYIFICLVFLHLPSTHIPS